MIFFLLAAVGDKKGEIAILACFWGFSFLSFFLSRVLKAVVVAQIASACKWVATARKSAKSHVLRIPQQKRPKKEQPKRSRLAILRATPCVQCWWNYLLILLHFLLSSIFCVRTILLQHAITRDAINWVFLKTKFIKLIKTHFRWNSFERCLCEEWPEAF